MVSLFVFCVRVLVGDISSPATWSCDCDAAQLSHQSYKICLGTELMFRDYFQCELVLPCDLVNDNSTDTIGAARNSARCTTRQAGYYIRKIPRRFFVVISYAAPGWTMAS